ncbi:hypothetical protein OAA15_00030 [bacterium]|nr:hypothetical protein [bacterium]
MAKGKIPNINNKLHGDKLVEVSNNSTGSIGFDEYNATLNNAIDAVRSSVIYDVDYAGNAIIATNDNLIISGTAPKMEIQDSNYSSYAWNSSRYIGSKTISAKYNEYQASGSAQFVDGTTGNWNGDQYFNNDQPNMLIGRGNPLGKVPAIDLYSTHFVLFDRVRINDAFANGDIFHCLYLIDDQGNKQPLSYRNKNLIDLQRLFVVGTNAEVLFLGQNNQEILDEYPITSVGNIASTVGQFTNDLITIDTNTDVYQPEFSDVSLSVSNGLLINKIPRQSDFTVRFVPSAFKVEQITPNTYKLKYSDIDIRNHFLNNPYPYFNVGLSFKKVYSRFCKVDGSSAQDYYWVDGDNNQTEEIHDSKFDPFYFLTYNPKTNKIFENTLLEQEVNWDLITNDPNNNQANASNQILSPPGISNNNIYLPGISTYTNTWTPLKTGDIINFGTIPVGESVPTSEIGITNLIATQNTTTGDIIGGTEVSENLRNHYKPNDTIQLEVLDVNIPVSQSYQLSINNSQNRTSYTIFTFDDEGNNASITGNTYNFTNASIWRLQQLDGGDRGIRNDYTPDATSISDSPNNARFSLLCDDNGYNIFGSPNNGEIINSPYSVHTIAIFRYLNTDDYSSFFDSLTHGDIIELGYIPDDYNTGNRFIDGRLRYKVLQTPIVGATNVYLIRVQFLPSFFSQDVSFIKNFYPSPINTDRWVISSMYKMNEPYIKVKDNNSTSNLQDSIQTSGSAISTISNTTHEQYITSQFLEGSGVGVLLPENYNPELREQLPDIINKTGIDINILS